MKKFLMIILIIFAGLGLAIGSLLGYGLITGRMAQEQRAQYMATWRGETLVPPPVETKQVVEVETPQQASERIAQAQTQSEIFSRELQLQMELLRDMKITVDLAQEKLSKDLKTLQHERDAIAEELAAQQEKAHDEGFKKALRNYSLMKPKDVVADFMAMEDTQAVRYLAAMKPDIATRVLSQFKTPPEKEKRVRLMQMMESLNSVTVKNSGR